MLLTELALVADTNQVTCPQLNQVAAALQKQAIRDFRPLWRVTATVDGFERLEDVPVGYWPIIVRDDIDMPGAAGVHLDQNGQPFALVQYSDSWSLTASHEMLEMLVDPWGNRLVAGQSQKPDQGRVEFLVEIADPSEDAQFGYTVNGLLVSDFLTPHFYDPVAVAGVRYSFGGHIPGPRQIVQGGYISWHDPVSDHWWQQTWFGGPAPTFRDLGKLTARAGSLRSAIDARTDTARRIAQSGPRSERFAEVTAFRPRVKESAAARAVGWRDQIEALKSGQLTEASWEGGEEG
ncbi:MAG TPA: hypothetical protein VEP73_09595 [Actinomycetota bacterium]|nr:hypothetical protein [Actinomycetota bacterium]